MRKEWSISLAVVAGLAALCLAACGQQKPEQRISIGLAAEPAPVIAHDDAMHAATLPQPRYGSVRERVRQYGGAVRACWKPYFAKQGIPYPPARVLLLGIKDADILEVYAAKKYGGWTYIRAYPILAASGTLGPKLRENDGQVPEGRYGIDVLNPNSAYHLSLHLNYPTAFDRRMARRDGRRKLGGDIMIHGNHVSAGCLAMGDAVAEDLFILAADTGIANVKVLLTPVDFRLRNLPADLPRQPAWTADLYKQLKKDLQSLPLPGRK